MNLFVSAFDDAFVFRYDFDTKKAKERIDIRYIFGPKHRVLHDLNDKAKTLQLPVVTLEQTNYYKDNSRIFNKNNHFIRPYLNNKSISKVPTPIPMNMDINMSIIGKFKEDLDQIIQNFVTQCKPYIIVSWQVPEEFNKDYIEEIRTEIQWNGNIDFENPNNISSDNKWRIIANTSFTIKGWVFPSLDTPEKPIYYIENNFISANLEDKIYTYDDYNSLSAISVNADTITLSAHPQITNFYYTNESITVPIESDITIKSKYDNRFIVTGKRFDRDNNFYLSANSDNFYTNFELISTATSPLISGYRLTEDEEVHVVSDNTFNVILSANVLSSSGDFKIISSNEAGWVVTDNQITNMV